MVTIPTRMPNASASSAKPRANSRSTRACGHSYVESNTAPPPFTCIALAIALTDAEALAKVTELGGSVLAGPIDIGIAKVGGDASRLA